DPLAGVTSRPDFVGLIYPGPSPFTRPRGPAANTAWTPPAIPHNAPPAFVVCAGSGDRVHAVWAIDYYSAMLAQAVPNIEMHIYAQGVHGGGLTDRHGIPFGTWQNRFIEWFRDLGFLDKPGVETKAAKDLAAYKPPAPRGTN